jgi:hypothetical protein
VQGAAGLKDEGQGMSCGHTTCKGFTAVRRSRFGHSDVATMHSDGDNPGKFFLALEMEMENTLSATRSTTFHAIPCLRAVGVKYVIHINYEVEDRPRDTLSEGRGRGGTVTVINISSATRSTTFQAIPCLRAVGGEENLDLYRLRGRLSSTRYPA